MITELGKPSLCPLLPIVPSLRRSAPHQLVLICLAAVKALAAPMASLWTHFYSLFWLKLTVFFWPLFNDFFFLFGVSLGFWSCSVCPCGCFHSKPPPPPKAHPPTSNPAPLPSSIFWTSPLSLWLTFLFHRALEAWEEIRKQKQKTQDQTIFCAVCLFIYFFFKFSSFFFVLQTISLKHRYRWSQTKPSAMLVYPVMLVHCPFSTHCSKKIDLHYLEQLCHPWENIIIIIIDLGYFHSHSAI